MDFLKYFRRKPRLTAVAHTRSVVPPLPLKVKTRSFMNMPHIFLVHNISTGDQYIATSAIPEQAILKVKGATVTLRSSDRFIATDISLAIRTLKDDPATLKNVMRHIID